MSITSVIVVFVITWWMILFISLPIGIEVDKNPQKGTASSAPKKPMIIGKMIVSTIISALLTFIFFYMLNNGYLDFIDLRELIN